MLNEFIDGYIYCALWSSVDGNGAPLDKLYSVKDLSEETRAKIVDDCTDFYNKNLDNLKKYCQEISLERDTEQAAWEGAGHDFWLTRNGHGCGYFDRDLSDNLSRELTDASHAEGECDLYVGDDNKLYVM